jgi:hypothetical protein
MKFPKARVFSPLQNLTHSWYKMSMAAMQRLGLSLFKIKIKIEIVINPLFFVTKLGTNIKLKYGTSNIANSQNHTFKHTFNVS